MSIVSATSAAASALYRQTDALARSAHNVANANTDGFEPLPPLSPAGPESAAPPENTLPTALQAQPGEAELRELSRTDIAQERINQALATAAFTANLKVIQTGDEMNQSLLDITA